MNITAKNKNSGKTYNILEFDDPRKEIQKDSLVCKFCEEPMSIKDGLHRAKHFYHLSECKSTLKRHPESAEHLLGKKLISEHVTEFWSEYSEIDIELEFPVYEANRIADIAFIFPSGWVVAHEIQLANITSEEIDERTKDYSKAGIDTIWWLGHNADSPANREWCISRYGYSLSIDYEILQSRVKEIQKTKLS